MKTLPPAQPDRLDPRSALWLVAALVMIAVPHAARVPWWLTAVAIALVAWRLYILRFALRLPGKWVLMAIASGAIAGTYLSYGRVLGRDPGVALLMVMLALKLLEMATLRDAMVLVFLGYFLVVTNFLYSQTIPTALYMLAAVWAITATMIGFQFRGRRPAAAVPFAAAGAMLLQAAPLALALFIFFPRVPGPLWGLPQDAHTGLTGLSDTMSPGTLSTLILSDAVAFRVKFDSPVPAPQWRYWRGPVLWNFDGRTWTAPRLPRLQSREYQALDKGVEYSVTVEPHNKRWLFALDLPATVPPRAAVTDDYQLLAAAPLVARERYAMTSHLQYRMGSDFASGELRRALALPRDVNPRALELAASMRARARDERDYITAVLAMFRDQNFYYTTSPPLLGANPVDEFLFATRAGFCEHYASAFAVLMRAAGIPARIVTGYQGGELNPLGDYLIVRQSDAHAWVEVWSKDEGWIRVDPTAAVSPQRVAAGVATAVPRADPLPLLARGDYEWLHRALLTWDSLAYTWNRLVLGYDPARQRELLARAGIDDATWRSLAIVLIASAGATTLVLALIMLRRLQAGAPDPVRRAYDRFCAKLARAGVVRAPTEGPLDFAHRAAARRRDLAPAIDTISALYIRLRYGTSAPPAEANRLRQLVAGFRP